MFDINFILNILVQVLCIFIFLTIFFFTYAAKKEGEIVKDQVNFLIDDTVGIHLNSMPDDLKKVLKSKINSIEENTPENIANGIKIDNSNNAIKLKTTKILVVLSILVLLVVVISYFLSKKGINFFKDLNLQKIGKETIVIVLFVALTEYIFLTYIGSKYVSIDPHEIWAHLFENIKKSLP